MFGKNEINESTLITDQPTEKFAKINSAITDSGFISSENLSESNITTEFPDTSSSGDVSTKNTSDMRIESGICYVSEKFSNLRMADPSLNDLSASNDNDTCDRVKWISEDHYKYYAPDEYGDTYLHSAIVQRCPEIALALIRHAPNPSCLDFEDYEGCTPLHLAVTSDQWRVVRWLIVAGAQPGLRNLRGESALHLAAKLGSVSCCRAITDPVQGEEREFLNVSSTVTSPRQVDLDQWDYEGQTCIHVAAQKGHIEVLKLLIWHGANVNAREGRSGYTALHYAVEKQNERLAYFLLTECEKLKAETQTYAGRSALQLGLPVKGELKNVLVSRGVASPLLSEDDSTMESDEEMIFENLPTYNMPKLVNSCA
ncbi:hypothetical protein WA026_012234 [Henosepilachna vigintioctopunctata]|uniref:NF-kappa-B inhibitor cactus n=1 Tax=Henosepilachna vigintioctopunctata TaxID=420089 RepID=A0AAW1V5C5_9CUCU